MSYGSDHHNTAPDARWRPAGVGLVIRAHCMGCNQHRVQAGGKGKPGPLWRCAGCVAAKAAKVGRA